MKPLVWGSCAAGDRTVPRHPTVCWKKPLVRGSFAAWGRTFSRNPFLFEGATCTGQLRCLEQNCFSEMFLFLEEATCPGQLRCLGQNFFQKSSFVKAYNAHNLNRMHFQNFWDSRAQNKTSEISKNALSGILGLLCSERDVGNLKKCTLWNSGTPVRRTRRRKSQANACSGIMGLLCAEQNVRNLKKMRRVCFFH